MKSIKDRIVIDYLAANGKKIDAYLPHGFGHTIDDFKEGVHFFFMPNEMLVLGSHVKDYCESPILYDTRTNGIEVKYENHKCWHSLTVVKHSFRLNALLASGVLNADKIDSNGTVLQREDYFLAISEDNGNVFVLRKDKCHLLYLGTTFCDNDTYRSILLSHRNGRIVCEPKVRECRLHEKYAYVHNENETLVKAISAQNSLVEMSTKKKYYDTISECEYEQRVYDFMVSKNYEIEINGKMYMTVGVKDSEIAESISKQKANVFYYFGKVGRIFGYREEGEFLMRNSLAKNDYFVCRKSELKSLVLKKD